MNQILEARGENYPLLLFMQILPYADAVLRTLNTCNLILIPHTTLRGSYCFPHFRDKERGLEKYQSVEA